MKRLFFAMTMTVFSSLPAFAQGGWVPNESVRIDRNTYAGMTGAEKLMKWREGVSPGGVKYRYYVDGSGALGSDESVDTKNWSIACTKDAINDTRNCHVSNYASRIFISLDTSGKFASVCVMGHDFPGRVANIRVDKNKPFTTSANGCTANKQVFDQLLKGDEVTTRSYEWPYDSNRDQTQQIRDLPEALDLARFIQKNIETVSFDQ